MIIILSFVQCNTILLCKIASDINMIVETLHFHFVFHLTIFLSCSIARIQEFQITRLINTMAYGGNIFVNGGNNKVRGGSAKCVYRMRRG